MNPGLNARPSAERRFNAEWLGGSDERFTSPDRCLRGAGFEGWVRFVGRGFDEVMGAPPLGVGHRHRVDV